MPGLIQTKTNNHRRHPDWLKVKIPSGEVYVGVRNLVKTNRLHTICEEARCPNLSECWSHGTATFLILGDVCTRHCLYCNVKSGKPNESSIDEPKKVADAVRKMNLRYVVITSVTRDDLEDGGASVYADTIREIKNINENCKVELLIPDLRLKNKEVINNENKANGKKNDKKININALKKIIEAKPDVLGHNIEAVRRVFSRVRPLGDYNISLKLLNAIKKIDKNMKTKSGLMVGLGETKKEIIETMKDLRKNDVDFLTIGQYLQPSPKNAKIARYYKPEEFDEFREIGMKMGFKHVEAGPLVRSSYRADKLNDLVK